MSRRPASQRLAAFALAGLFSLGILGATFRDSVRAAVHSSVLTTLAQRALGVADTRWALAGPAPIAPYAFEVPDLDATALADATARAEVARAADASRQHAAAMRAHRVAAIAAAKARSEHERRTLAVRTQTLDSACVAAQVARAFADPKVREQLQLASVQTARARRELEQAATALAANGLVIASPELQRRIEVRIERASAM